MSTGPDPPHVDVVVLNYNGAALTRACIDSVRPQLRPDDRLLVVDNGSEPADRRTVAEGAFTAPVLKRAADAAGVDMPIVASVCDLLSGSASVDQVVERLLSRPLRSEGV